jgi:tetratricopeptide (TPR) repeat protein
MKYRVNHLHSTSILLTILLGVPVMTVGQSTQCECATPPGGSVTCEKGQVPICIVKNGKVTSICKSPPEDKKTIAQQNAWVLSIILGKDVTEDDLKLKPEYQSFLRHGSVITAEANITFQAINPPAEFLPRRSTYRTVRTARIDPNHKFSLSELSYLDGMSLLDKEQYAKAETRFRETLKLEPYWEDAYLGLGVSYYRRGMLDEAEAAFQKGLRLNPASSDLNVALGSLYYEKDRFSEAEAMLKSAALASPGRADVHDALGIILYAQLKFADAEAAFRRASESGGGSNAAIYTRLGDALFAQQKYAEAKAAYALADRVRGHVR